MKRILCAVPKTTVCGSTTREGKMNNNNNDMNTTNTNTNKGGGGENKNWSNAYEKFRKEASDLTEEEAKELWRKTQQCMAQEDEVQLRLYAELDLIYGSDDDDDDDDDDDEDDEEEEEEEAVENNLNNTTTITTTTTNNNNNKTNNARSKQLLKRNSQRHKDLVHERVRIALANEIRQKAIEADSVDPFDMIMSSSDQSLKKVGLSRIRSSE